MIEGYYPGAFERVKAVLADSIIMIILMFFVTYLFSFFENVPDNWRIGAFVFIFFLYEPLFTSILGGTIGHILIGIKVKRDQDESKNIAFPVAVVRFFIKAVMGMLSLLLISSNGKRKAIHDMVAGSIVLYR